MYNILIIEDDAMIASGLVYALEQEGYSVTHGKSVSDAKRAIDANMQNANSHNAGVHYDLAILDMQLPDGTGFDVRERDTAQLSSV